MAHILHLDSSPRGERSISRQLSREFIEGLESGCTPPIPWFTATWGTIRCRMSPSAWVVGALYSARNPSGRCPSKAMQLSELRRSTSSRRPTVTCLGVPMHNFCMPYVRSRRTWTRSSASVRTV